jgi:1,4-alpha-glucan branching enzyme
MKKKTTKTVSKKGKTISKKGNKSPCEKDIPNNIKKQYVKSKSTCKVTFRLPKDAAPDAKSVTIVGDFNNWNVTQTPMKKLKNGGFTLTLELPCDREYNFRYLIDSNRWEKDWFADKHIPGDSDVDDSVVVL